jgi:hypothetical protein
MKGLLIVLCALGSLVGVFVGGCGLVVAGIGVANWMLEPVTTAAVVVCAGAAIMLVNLALINAVRRGHAGGRRGAFLALAGLDLFVAYAALCLGGSPAGVGLAAPLALKGVLTILVVLRGGQRLEDEPADSTDGPGS